MILTSISLVCFVFTIWFTFKTYNGTKHTKAAIIESWTNLLIGFAINFCANLLILPLVGLKISLVQNFAIGWIYSAISILRSYAIRRFFQKRDN